MADDGRSALTAVSRSIFVPDTGARTRSFGAPVPEPTTSTSITAEIPAIPAGPSYGVLLPDGSIWYPGSRKRLPAPLLLRIFVWILALATLLAGAGDFVIHYHPAWANPFRRIVTATATVTNSGGAPGVGTSKTPGTGPGSGSTFGALSPQPAGLPPFTTAYTVPKGGYTVQIAETIPGHSAWAAAWAATGGQTVGFPVKEQTLTTGQQLVVPAMGEMKVQVAAQGATVQILQNDKVVGTVAEHSPWIWWFVPAGTSFNSAS